MRSAVRPRIAEGQLYLIVAIDRPMKFAVVELVEKDDMRAAAAFLEALVEALLTASNGAPQHGIQFAAGAKRVWTNK
jgi:hypothetical protein